jgi:hypothetical protein
MSAENGVKPSHAVAAEFLNARHWVVSAIAGSITSPQGTSEKAIEELLIYERCAAWLLASMTASGSISNASPGIAEVIRKAAAKETQSAMSARLEGRELSSVATRLGIPIVVLKGGVRAIEGDSPALPIVDIDILVRPENIDTVVKELERSGFGKPLPALTHHRGIAPATGRLSIEVHWTTYRDGTPLDSSLWDRIEPIANTPGLHALSNVDQLLHVVRHALLNHRQRPVTIRDTLLAGIAAQRCSEDELSRVRRELESDPNASEAAEMIAFGQRLIAANGDAADPFIDKCATFYSAVAVARRLPRSITSSAALAFVTEIALGRVGVMYALKNSLQWRGTDVSELSTLGQKFPRVTRPLIGLAHLGYYSLSAAVALPMIYRTRSKALREIGRRKP